MKLSIWVPVAASVVLVGCAAPAAPTASTSSSSSTAAPVAQQKVAKATKAPPKPTAPSWTMAAIKTGCDATNLPGATTWDQKATKFTGRIGQGAPQDTNDYTWCVLRALEAPPEADWSKDGKYSWPQGGATMTATVKWGETFGGNFGKIDITVT